MRDERMNLRRRRPWYRVQSECGECGAPKPAAALACGECLALGTSPAAESAGRIVLSQKCSPSVRRRAHGRPTRAHELRRPVQVVVARARQLTSERR